MSARRVVRWTAHLRRRTTSGAWMPELDGLRFLAIASVLFFHLQSQLERHYTLAVPRFLTWLARAFDLGHRGVPLFFVLSGFILGLPFARHHLFAAPAPSLRRYFLRRITRLEPPYLLNLVLVAVGVAVADHSAWRMLLPHLAASAVYLHYAIFHTGSTINSVAWSLEVEVQFYILAPLLTLVFAINRSLARRIVLALAMLASAALQMVFNLSQYTLAGDLQFFLAGLLLADLYLTGTYSTPANGRPTRRTWDLISLTGWPVFFLLDNRYSGFWLSFLALLLCLAAFRGEFTPRILRRPAIAITGGMCYTIYLWHAPVLTAVDRALRLHPALLPSNYLCLYLSEAAIKFGAVALLCLPLFVLVERPCMDPQWPHKLLLFLRRARVRAGILVPARARSPKASHRDKPLTEAPTSQLP